MFEPESLLYGLSIACPLHNCNESCPIDKIREMPIKERIHHLESLSKEEKANLVKMHNKCIEEFEAKYFKNIKK